MASISESINWDSSRRIGTGTLVSSFQRLWLIFSLVGSAFSAIAAADRAAFDEEMAGYKNTEASGPVATLNRRIEQGQISLAFDPSHGYLLSLLKELGVPVSSQLLVASKTSPNRLQISPKNPRALYFRDSVAIAYVPSAQLIELASSDPNLGTAFYTLEQKESLRPRLVRDNRCLECHASSKTLDTPGLLVRSFLTRDDGDVDVLSGLMVTHRTPISERWGGYYVTGTYGKEPHRGNLFGANLDPRARSNIDVTDLKRFLDTSKYPEPGSDIVALMVLDHQVQMQNLLTRYHYDSINALRNNGSLQPAYPSGEAVLKYLLFTDEVQLKAEMTGTSTFAENFAQQGPADREGRSLREFDLRSRLFKYPCSFMIYSPAFDSLPIQARKHLYRRLWDILSNEKDRTDFKISAEMGKSIREVITATKTDLPEYWRL